MISLILDTTGSPTFIATAQNGVVISKIVLSDGRQLSKLLLPSIQSILQGNTPHFIAIGTGPGSFTGTRVGAMVAKTLAYAWKIPLVPFASTRLPDLSAIALTTHQDFSTGAFPDQIELVYISSTT